MLLEPNHEKGENKQVSFKPDIAVELLSKYETNSHEITREPPNPIFVEGCWFPVNLIDICKYVQASSPRKMNKPAFEFVPSKAAAEKNRSVLKSFDLDLSKALEAEKGSQLAYGSEFKDVKLLELIFQHHPLWSRMKSHLSYGCSYPLSKLSKEEERKDLEEAFAFGNHRGVAKNQKLFESIIDSEIDSNNF